LSGIVAGGPSREAEYISVNLVREGGER
jgi:hypothetical protein